MCTAKQMVKWFRPHVETTEYLGLTRLVKSEKVEAVPVVPKKTEAGPEVEEILSFRNAHMH